MKTLHEAAELIFAAKPVKMVLSKTANKAAEYKKIVIVLKQDHYQIEKYTDKQVFHENVSALSALAFCENTLQKDYLQLNAWDQTDEHILLLSKKGAVTYKKTALKAECAPTVQLTHDRKKHYLFEEGTSIEPLIDMGIFTKEGKVVRSMFDKFKQINRFAEIIDDCIKEQAPKHLNIIDFGCGKSYLTFILYYYFTEIKKIPVHMVGLDLKAEVIDKCNRAAEKYGYKDLHFELGDIDGYQCDFAVDMVITLHACDTATDYALYNAVKWNAEMIFSVPCCQHELSAQMQSDKLSLFTRYGIIQERAAALMTDAIRGALLETCGYKTQLLEFVDLAHTPKNILIRAVKKKSAVSKAVKHQLMTEIENTMQEFHLQPTLYKLLSNHTE